MKFTNAHIAGALGALAGLIIWVPAYTLPRTSFDTMADANPAEWWMAGFAGLSLVVIVVQAGLFFWQLGLMRKDSSRTFRPDVVVRNIAAERVWDVRSEGSGHVSTLTLNFRIDFSITNIGPDTATIRGAYVVNKLYDKPRPFAGRNHNDNLPTEKFAKYQDALEIVGAQVLRSGDTLHLHSTALDVTPHGRNQRVVTGVIVYTDESGAWHETGFIRSIEGNGETIEKLRESDFEFTN